MGRKKIPASIRMRSYVGLLYPTDKQHMKTLKYIQRHWGGYYCGCWHTIKENGVERVKGELKKHLHIVLHFKNPRLWSALASDIGIPFDPEIGCRFLRPVGYDSNYDESGKRYTYKGALIYLVHRNAPEKEQYPVTALFGSSDMVALASRYIREYESRDITLTECLNAVKRFCAYSSKIITPEQVVDWFLLNPEYMRFMQNKWVERLIDFHNWKIRCDEVSCMGSVQREQKHIEFTFSELEELVL